MLVPNFAKIVADGGRAPGPPIVLHAAGSVDLDPEAAASDADFELEYGVASTLRARAGASLARVSKASLATCSTTNGWTQEIKVAQSNLVCVTTDLKRYVIIEIMSAQYNMITYRVLQESPAPTP